MPLQPQSKLGPYEIETPLGKGGMGEVWAARDPRVDRRVAIKVLPAEMAHDPERVSRFEREAKALAALQHPNVATLYGFEEGDVDGEPTRFLVMELVEGETLAEVLERGPLPVDRAVDLFHQIARGLEAAHDRGLVHRDLKPANVMITPEGEVKILDFGLARAGDPDGASSSEASAELTHSPTLSLGATQAGTLLGTAAYMSPEQARGQPADRRSDVWAFGVCLLEALSGRRPFQGSDVAETLASVLKDEPDLTTLPAGVGVTLRTLLRRCLTRDPRQRLPSIGAARLELEEWDPKADGAQPAGSNARRFGPAIAAALLLGGLVGALLVFFAMRTGPTSVSETDATTRFVLRLPEDQRLRVVNRPFALRPDGLALAYVAQQDGDEVRLWLWPFDRLEPLPVAGSEGARNPPVFSPDGRWLAFERDSRLWKVSAEGGPAEPMADLRQTLRGVSWSEPDRLFVTVGGGSPPWLLQVDARSTGAEAVELELPHDLVSRAFEDPYLLPGEEELWLSRYHSRSSPSRLFVYSLETSQLREVGDGRTPRLIDLATSTALFSEGDNLWLARANPANWSLEPRHSLLATGLSRSLGGAPVDATNNGTVAYLSSTPDVYGYRLILVSRDGSGAGALPEVEPGYFVGPVFSPDGRYLAVVRDQRGLVLYELEKGTTTNFNFGDSDSLGPPVWSTDGSPRLALKVAHTEVGSLDVESGNRDLLWRSDGVLEGTALRPHAWLPDGRLVMRPATSRDLVLVTPGETAPRPLLVSPDDENWATASPDGRYLAYEWQGGTGESEIRVLALDGDTDDTRVVARGAQPLWSKAEDEIFFRRGYTVLSAKVTTEGGFRKLGEQVLFDLVAETGSGMARNYDYDPIRKRFVFLTPREGQAEIVVVRNAGAELREAEQ